MDNQRNDFWKQLPFTDDPAAANLPAETLLKLCAYWQGMLSVSNIAYIEHGRVGAGGVRALLSRAARLLAIAAEPRGYDSSRITAGHRAAMADLAERAARADDASEDMDTLTPITAPEYQAAFAEVERLRIKLWTESQQPPLTTKGTSQIKNPTRPAFPKDVAKLLHMSKPTLMKDKTIAREQVNPPKGKLYRFDLDDIEKLNPDAADKLNPDTSA
jgi:hypothetical protein